MNNFTASGVLNLIDRLDIGCYPLINAIGTYLAGIRLHAFASRSEWLVGYEWLRFDETNAEFERLVYAFGNRLANQGYQGESCPVTPLDEGLLYRTAPDECVLNQMRFKVLVKGASMSFELDRTDYTEAGVDLEDGLPIAVHIIRYLEYSLGDVLYIQSGNELLSVCGRDDVGLERLLLLKEYYHPNFLEEAVKDIDTYRQIAQVLASHDPSLYHPSDLPNNHWTNVQRPFE